MPESTSKYQKKHNISEKYVSLWIEESTFEKEPQIYFCSQCRCPVFEFKGDLITESPGNSPSKVPITKKCPNKNCGRKYQINAVVKI